MTIATNDRRKEYAANGATKIFTGPRAFAASDVAVYLVNDATGVATLQAAGYTLTGVGARNTVVTFDTAPASGQTVQILRTVGFTQLTDISNQGAYLPEVLENALDAIAQQTQQLADRDDRTIRLSDNAVLPSGFSAELPSADPLAPLVWNAAGTALENGSTELTGDMLLRNHLADEAEGRGSDLITARDPISATFLKTQSDINQGIPVSLFRFVDPTKISGIRAKSTTYDATSALVEAAGAARCLQIPHGLFLYAGNIPILNDAMFSVVGEGPGHSVLRCMGAGGFVYTNSNNYDFGMPRLDVRNLTMQAGVANAGNAFTLTGTGGSGYAGEGTTFENVSIVPSAAGFYWNKGVRGTNVRNAKFGAVRVISNAMTGQTTHAFHFDGASDPVELWFDDFCYLAVLTTGILVEGTYEGIYLHGINMTTVQDGLIYKPTGAQPVCHVQNSYINCRRTAVDLRDVAYFDVSGNGIASTGIGAGDFWALQVDRTGGLINASRFHGNKVIGGNGYTGGATENGVRVVSGTKITVNSNDFYTLTKGVEFVAGAALREFDNEYTAVTTPVTKPAAVSAASQHPEVMLRAVTGAAQAVPVGSSQKLTFGTALTDNYNYYATDTSRWTPPTGTYQVNAHAYFTTNVQAGDVLNLSIRKNDGPGEEATATSYTGKAGQLFGNLSCLIVANGTDYFEIVASIESASGTLDRTKAATASLNYWHAHAIR